MWIEEITADYRRRKAALDWLDAHCWIGVGPRALLRPVDTLGAMRQLMERYGVRRAIVAHAAARDHDPDTGNQLLLAAIRENASWYGAAVLALGDRSPEEFRRHVQALVAGKVRLVRVFPRSHNFLLAEWSAGPWLAVLEELRMPLAVWHTETTWDDVAAVCRAHPALPVIVEGPQRKLLYHNRIYYRLFERFANFHLEIHNLVNYLGLDDVVTRFGSERLIFGTLLPHQDPNVAMMLVTHGRLSGAQREDIAHRNMERLMAAVEGVS